MSSLVNSHEHVWSESYPWVSDLTPPGVEKLVYSAEDLLADMEALGIDRTCVIASPIHGRGSPYTLDCLESHPDRLDGVVLLDYFADDIEDRVDEVFERDTLLGVRLGAVMEYGTMWEHRTTDADWITDPGLAPFWRAIERQESAQVQLIVEADQLDQVITVAEEHPDVTVVVDHLAWPRPDRHPPDEPPFSRVAELAECDNVYVKVTHTPSTEPFPFRDVHGHVRRLLEEFGSDHLLWGSDQIYHFKEATPWESLHFLDELEFLSRGDRRDMLGRTYRSIR